ncbi:putative SAM-dependent O-methyltransferase [Truncatella angustata]|uniref:SAM-dependent O-methyltransferase n=1 Tax=Truncatella angustata TaxID=152316 RepID=A0A9P8USW2_9PEZI|nr:putative SAM-dependent O-methyltransferase [Truncatella angustata]KAH6658495.1 putative SAM-dependent O-methyltransferase [Truncatella angustata]
MLGSVLPFNEETADRVSEYCEKRSTVIPDVLQKHWEYTRTHFSDADKMSSRLQGAWMIFTAKDRKPKRGTYISNLGEFILLCSGVTRAFRLYPSPKLMEITNMHTVLEIGAYSGYSALAWYEGTKDTKAEIVTLELSPKMIAASRKTFKDYGVEDRVKLIEGPADQTLKTLKGDFDIIFVDANKDGYATYVQTILDQKLLSQNGIILCDNVFARGLTIGADAAPWLNDHVRPYWLGCGQALDEFNTRLVEDPRVDVLIMPVFDGVTQIKWRSDAQI